MMIRFTILALPHHRSAAPDGPRRRSAPHFTYSVLCVDSAAWRLFVEGVRHGAAAATDRPRAAAQLMRSSSHLINDRARPRIYDDSVVIIAHEFGACRVLRLTERARLTD